MVRRRGHTEEQILAALRQAEGGTTVVDVCRQMGISEQTFVQNNSSPIVPKTTTSNTQRAQIDALG